MPTCEKVWPGAKWKFPAICIHTWIYKSIYVYVYIHIYVYSYQVLDVNAHLRSGSFPPYTYICICTYTYIYLSSRGCECPSAKRSCLVRSGNFPPLYSLPTCPLPCIPRAGVCMLLQCMLQCVAVRGVCIFRHVAHLKCACYPASLVLYIYLYTHTRTRTRIRTRKHSHTQAHTHAHTHTHIGRAMYIFIHTYTHMHTHMHMYTSTHTRTRTRTHTHTHTYTYTHFTQFSRSRYPASLSVGMCMLLKCMLQWVAVCISRHFALPNCAVVVWVAVCCGEPGVHFPATLLQRVMLQYVLQCLRVMFQCVCSVCCSVLQWVRRAFPRHFTHVSVTLHSLVLLQCVWCCSVCVCCCSMRAYMYVCMLSCIPRAGVLSQHVCDVAVSVRCCSVYILLQYVCVVAVCMCCCSVCDCIYVFICVTLHPSCWHVVAACVYCFCVCMLLQSVCSVAEREFVVAVNVCMYVPLHHSWWHVFAVCMRVVAVCVCCFRECILLRVCVLLQWSCCCSVCKYVRVYVCLCVCMHVCMYVCMYVCMLRTRTRAHIRRRRHTCSWYCSTLFWLSKRNLFTPNKIQ